MVLKFGLKPAEEKIRGGMKVSCELPDGTSLVAHAKHGKLTFSGSWERQHYGCVDFRSLFADLAAKSARFAFGYQRQTRTAEIEFKREFSLGVTDLEIFVALDLLVRQIEQVRKLPQLPLATRRELGPNELLVA